VKVNEVYIFIALSILLTVGCSEEFEQEESSPMIDIENAMLADDRATQATFELRSKLVEISEQGVAFGHQEATAYGMNWEHAGFPSDSDVFRVSGDYPAVIGFDLGRIEQGRTLSINGIRFSLMRELIQEAHEEGSIITLSWHARNPITGGSPWQVSGRINRILPSGDRHDILESYVASVANFVHTLVDSDGRPIPILFRPWHEMNGNWFWWGSDILSPEEFKELFRSTVDLLTNTHDIHQLLYTYSPNCAITEEDYLQFYPGDNWVDILGVDVYDFVDESYVDIASTSLQTIAFLGHRKNKPFAFTETGLENIVESDWWMNKLYPVIQNSGAAYTLLWRNDRQVHWFAPFENHHSSENFLEFVAKPDVLLRSDLE